MHAFLRQHRTGKARFVGKPLISTSLLVAILIVSVACAPARSSNSISSSACEAPLSRNDKIQIAATTTVARGTQLIAVLKDSCDELGPISRQLSNRAKGSTQAGIRSYPWTPDENLSWAQLTQMAAKDFCLEMITADETTPLEPDIQAAAETIPDDPHFAREKHLFAIGATAAYDVFYAPATGIRREVVIAIIDSGVRIDHEDLRDNLWINRREIPGNRRDDDGNGYIDDVHGYNFASDIPSPLPERTSANSAWQWAHGTKVAGLAAATAGNGKGGAGIAGSAKIMALNNMGRTASMSQAHTANAIRYAVDNGADVINLSLGGNNRASVDYKNALTYAVSRGVVVLAAAGNERMRIDQNYSAAGVASAIEGLISIGNFQSQSFSISTTSNYSTEFVELGAPGTNTMASLLYTTTPSSSASYGYFSGTSAAVPVASGAAALAIALIKSRGYTVKAAQIERLLLDSAKKSTSLRSFFKSGNALDLANLARLIDRRYPAGGSASGDQVPDLGGSDENTDQTLNCP